MLRLVFMVLAMLAAIAGTVLFMIDNRTQWLPAGVGNIGGTASFMISGMFWMLYGMSYRLLKRVPQNNEQFK